MNHWKILSITVRYYVGYALFSVCNVPFLIMVRPGYCLVRFLAVQAGVTLFFLVVNMHQPGFPAGVFRAWPGLLLLGAAITIALLAAHSEQHTENWRIGLCKYEEWAEAFRLHCMPRFKEQRRGKKTCQDGQENDKDEKTCQDDFSGE
jgi:hypothetical protein